MLSNLDQFPTKEKSFERFPITNSDHRRTIGKAIAHIAIQVSQITADFAQVERIPRYADGQRENDVEHSYMLALAANEIAATLELNLDSSLLNRFALVHDLLEIKTGDVATFDLSPEALAEKERREHQAKQELMAELPPVIATDLSTYERQDTREAVFIRMIDKLLPVAVDITGDGARVLREDYGVTTHEELCEAHSRLHARIAEKFGDAFPDLVAAHGVLCEMFEEQYLSKTPETPQRQEVPRGPVETERKYKINLDDLPSDIDLERLKKIEIYQGYIATGTDGSEMRVRSLDSELFELTVKTPGMIARSEHTIPLSLEMFTASWKQTEGRRVRKTRYNVPCGEYTIELDIYHDGLEGLVTAEVEFHGREAEASVRATTFVPPEWFGEDVSEDPRYKNHNLSITRPHEPLIMGAEHY